MVSSFVSRTIANGPIRLKRGLFGPFSQITGRLWSETPNRIYGEESSCKTSVGTLEVFKTCQVKSSSDPLGNPLPIAAVLGQFCELSSLRLDQCDSEKQPQS